MSTIALKAIMPLQRTQLQGRHASWSSAFLSRASWVDYRYALRPVEICCLMQVTLFSNTLDYSAKTHFCWLLRVPHIKCIDAYRQT